MPNEKYFITDFTPLDKKDSRDLFIPNVDDTKAIEWRIKIVEKYKLYPKGELKKIFAAFKQNKLSREKKQYYLLLIYKSTI
jgi:hypothetical protein